MQQSTGRRVATSAAGLLGFFIGLSMWWALWANFSTQISPATTTNLSQSSAFVVICFVAAIALSLGIGLAASWAVGKLTDIVSVRKKEPAAASK